MKKITSSKSVVLSFWVFFSAYMKYLILYINEVLVVFGAKSESVIKSPSYFVVASALKGFKIWVADGSRVTVIGKKLERCRSRIGHSMTAVPMGEKAVRTRVL